MQNVYKTNTYSVLQYKMINHNLYLFKIYFYTKIFNMDFLFKQVYLYLQYNKSDTDCNGTPVTWFNDLQIIKGPGKTLLFYKRMLSIVIALS